MHEPSSSAKILAVPVLLWLSGHFLSTYEPNPFAHFLFISGRIPESSDAHPLYRKTYWDVLFVAYYVVFWSFARQSLFEYVLRPLGRYFGLRKAAKLDRFAEQGYAVVYFGAFAIFGIAVMRELPTWWFKTEHFWIGYPHWEMPGKLKTYYLMQMAYWLQQFLVLVLRIEAPRKDWKELIAHHVVTLWLICGSYLLNMTPMGNAVFLTMDSSDIWLGLSKCINYIGMVRTSTVSFIWFIGVWTYMRHWLNIKMLWSVYAEFELIEEHNRVWRPADGLWMPWWVKWQMFVPVLLIQLLNVMWSVSIWRILIRAVCGAELADERSDDEDEPKTPENGKVLQEPDCLLGEKALKELSDDDDSIELETPINEKVLCDLAALKEE